MANDPCASRYTIVLAVPFPLIASRVSQDPSEFPSKTTGARGANGVNRCVLCIAQPYFPAFRASISVSVRQLNVQIDLRWTGKSLTCAGTLADRLLNRGMVELRPEAALCLCLSAPLR